MKKNVQKCITKKSVPKPVKVGRGIRRKNSTTSIDEPIDRIVRRQRTIKKNGSK